VESLLVTTRATLGEVAIAALPVTTNQGFKSIIPNAQTDPLFTYYLIGTLRSEMKRLASGTTFLEISKADFSRIRMLRPERSEQERIAAVLDTLDNGIAKTEALIEKLKQLRAGFLHEFTTRGLDDNGDLRNPLTNPEDFYQSSIGRIPKGWTPGVLADLVPPDRPIVYGILMPGSGVPRGVPVIKVKDIKDRTIGQSDLLLTDPKIDAVYRRSRLKSGDLLFTIRGTVGRMAIVPPELNEANITQDTARLSLQSAANPEFIAGWLETEIPTRFVRVHTIGVAVRGINLRDVRRIPIPVVPRPEQDAIAAILEKMERKIMCESQFVAKLKSLKSGMSADLLTGRVRVRESILAEAISA
jgi:type I restriction enzyme S subunit